MGERMGPGKEGRGEVPHSRRTRCTSKDASRVLLSTHPILDT